MEFLEFLLDDLALLGLSLGLVLDAPHQIVILLECLIL